MLRNPVYVGKQVWDQRDNATRREQGGSAPWQSEDEWTSARTPTSDREPGPVRRRAGMH